MNFTFSNIYSFSLEYKQLFLLIKYFQFITFNTF